MKKILCVLILAMFAPGCSYKFPTYDTTGGAVPVNELEFYSSEDLKNAPKIEKQN